MGTALRITFIGASEQMSSGPDTFINDMYLIARKWGINTILKETIDMRVP